MFENSIDESDARDISGMQAEMQPEELFALICYSLDGFKTLLNTSSNAVGLPDEMIMMIIDQD